MKNNVLLTIVNICFNVMGGLIILSFLLLTGLLVIWHIDPEISITYLLFPISKIYGPNAYLGYTITESFLTGNIENKNPFSIAHVNRFSLYFIYLQSITLLLFYLLVIKESVNVITSVKLDQSFRIENFKSFKKIGKYFFIIFCLSSFYQVNTEYSNFYGVFVHPTPLILMLGAYTFAEIFREGNMLQEEVSNTI